MLGMEHEHKIYEVLGVTKFMIFLSKRLGDREYQRVRDLQTEYLDGQLDEHLESSGIQAGYDQ
jgi:hypothetical protein